MAAHAAGLSRPWLSGLAAAVAGLNLFDGIFTLAFLRLGLCSERNPLMAALYACAPWVFLGAKLALVNGCLWVLWRLRHKLLAQVALAACAGVYLALVTYELHTWLGVGFS